MSAHDLPLRFNRTVGLYGADGFARIRAARAVVVGLGGVGAHAAAALARSGIGTLLLIDGDVVTTTSLNRHPCAGGHDVGRPKTLVLAEFLRRTCPDTAVETRDAVWGAATADDLFTPQPVLVIDAIDDLPAKVHLIARCVADGAIVIASMGAARRADPAALRSGDVMETRGCPLATRLRRLLRDAGVTGGVPCVWSVETPREFERPATEVREGVEAPLLDRIDDRKPLPSGMCLPGIFGYAAAAMGLDRLAATSGPSEP